MGDRRWVMWLPAPLVALAYLPVLVASYGYSDDYRVLYGLQRDPGEVAGSVLGNARPGMLALLWLGSLVVDDVGGLRWLRLLTVAGLAVLAVRIAMTARDAGRSVVVASAFGAAVALLPPSQVAASWSIMWVVPWAMLAAIEAARLADRGRLVVPAALLSVAILVYQPAAMCYWLPLVLAADQPRSRRDVARHGAVLASAACAGAVAWLAGRGMQEADGRASLSRDPLGQADWFLTYVLPRALSPAPISTPPAVVLALLVFLLAGLVLAERRSPRRLGLLLAAIPASYATSLVIAADLPTARSMLALAPVVWALYLRAAAGFGVVLPQLVRFGPPVAVAVALGMALGGARSVQVYFADPQQREWRMVTAAVAGVEPGERMAVAQTDWNDHLAPARSLDEFGMLSSTYPWCPVPMVELARREATGAWSGRTTLADSGPSVLELAYGVTTRK